jgi:uncharacterized membrane protein YkvA (DUF1232 family)
MTQVPPLYNRFLEQAQKLIKNLDKLIERLSAADSKMEDKGDAIGTFIEDLKTLVRLVRSWIHHEYEEIPTTTIIGAVAAILYFIFPLDIIPDPIPVAGYLDDAAFVAFVIKSIKADLERFFEWEKKNGGRSIVSK